MSNPNQRRSNPRNQFSCFARFRQPDMGAAGPEYMCVTKDFSHDGIYFLAEDHGLRENMKLLLSFPYSEQSLVKDRQYLVEIKRVQRISSFLQKRCGVGAKLILQMPMKQHDGLFVPETAVSEQTLPDDVLQHIDLYA